MTKKATPKKRWETQLFQSGIQRRKKGKQKRNEKGEEKKRLK